MHDGKTPLDILIIDDSDDDFEATERAFRKIGNMSNPIRRCVDGLDALTYLKGEGRYAAPNRPARPGLILLDLNMPGMDGREVLKRLKEDADLCGVPIVVMSTSTEQADIAGCYRTGANTFIEKRFSWNEYTETVQRLHEYWFHTALLPN